MKIQIEAKVLGKAMKHAASALQSTAIIPILANVRLIADGDTVEITTSDFDTEFRQTLPLVKGGEMATTVDAKRLAMIAGTAPAGAVLTISMTDARLTITAGKSRWVLPILPADDYPVMPVEASAKPLKIGGTELARALRRVQWAISTEKSQPHMAGIYFNAEGKHFRAVAVNTTSMAVATTGATFPKDADSVIVPAKYAALLADMAESHGDDTIAVQWNERKIRAEIGSAVLSGKLIDATFPDYRRIIPEFGTPIIFEPAAVSDAIKRVLVITEEKTRSLKIERGDGKIILHASAAATGMSSEEIPADCAAGETTGLNGQQLSEIVAAIGGDSIEMHQSEPGRAVVFRRVVDDGAFALTMPMKGR